MNQSETELNLTVLGDELDLLDEVDLGTSVELNGPAQNQELNQVTFDSAKGFMTINSDSPVPTENLNQQNFYNLLLKLQQNNQLELNNDSSLTSQFYLSPEELNLLMEPTQSQEQIIQADLTPVFQAYPAQSEEYSLLNTESIQTSFEQQGVLNKQQETANKCQEMCCLLKFNALDDFNNLF